MQQSFISVGIGALLTILFIIWLIIKWKTMSDFERLVVLILICTFIAINVIIYYVIDIYYNVNPLIEKWKVIGEPIKGIRNYLKS